MGLVGETEGTKGCESVELRGEGGEGVCEGVAGDWRLGARMGATDGELDGTKEGTLATNGGSLGTEERDGEESGTERRFGTDIGVTTTEGVLRGEAGGERREGAV
jgi:hypothetical protein